MSRLPPDTTKAVTNIKVETRIDAPSSTVWKVILDFPTYGEWNPFVRSQAITDSSFKPMLAHTKPTEGAHVLLHCRIPPRGLDDDDKGLTPSKEIITYLDDANYRVLWEQVGIPTWLLRAERWQEVTEEQVDGKTYTKYMTVEAFNGLGAYFVRWFMRSKLITSFEAMAEGLKNRSEGLARNQRS